MAAEAFVLSHFATLVGSPSFPGWLTKRLEKRLQTIGSFQLSTLYSAPHSCYVVAAHGAGAASRPPLTSTIGFLLSRLPSKPRLIGYARVSTEDQATDPQVDELKAAGCHEIHQEFASGASRARPVLSKLLLSMKAGESLVVVRLDRLARSVRHLLEVIETLEARGAHFRSLRDPIDTSTPQGMFSLQVLGAVAQLERSLISERTRAGIKAATSRGKRPGNPGIRSKDASAIRKAIGAREEIRLNGLISTADSWLPTVRRLRPTYRWEDVVRVLNASGQAWNTDRLRRAVKRMVSEGLAEQVLLDPAPRRPSSTRLTDMIRSMLMIDPDLSLRQIATKLEEMREPTPRGGSRWSASSVKSLLDRANPGAKPQSHTSS
jgi:DNA invertase Pin-like site-specific DNA recombinase